MDRATQGERFLLCLLGLSLMVATYLGVALSEEIRERDERIADLERQVAWWTGVGE